MKNSLVKKIKPQNAFRYANLSENPFIIAWCYKKQSKQFTQVFLSAVFNQNFRHRYCKKSNAADAITFYWSLKSMKNKHVGEK